MSGLPSSITNDTAVLPTLTSASQTNLSGASLATVTPNPTLANVGTNSAAQDFQALSGVVSQFGSTIGDLFGGGSATTPSTVIIRTSTGTTWLSSSTLTSLLVLVAIGLVLFLILDKEE
jgi:hypothetical protein